LRKSVSEVHYLDDRYHLRISYALEDHKETSRLASLLGLNTSVEKPIRNSPPLKPLKFQSKENPEDRVLAIGAVVDSVPAGQFPFRLP
jgi:hypothetical protein